MDAGIGTLVISGLFLSNQQAWTLYASGPRKGFSAYGMEEGSTIIWRILRLRPSTIVPAKPSISSSDWFKLLFWFRTVIELYAGSFPREQCASITGLRPFYTRKVKII